MEIIKIFLLFLAFFLGLSYLVHICSKHNYAIKYSSPKRKIEIYPVNLDKSHTNQWDKGFAFVSFII